MVSKRMIGLLIVVLATLAIGQVRAEPPSHFSYQGMVLNDGVPFDGDARFRFALVDTSENVYVWSNDGTRGMPEETVLLKVNNGIFSVLLGAPPMARINPADLENFDRHQALRVWVDLGGGSVQLGDLPLSSVLFAQHAEYAHQSESGFTAGGWIWSRLNGFRFPDGTTQSTAASSSGGGGASTLDEAYDGGGAGLGRTINADAGAVAIGGNNWDLTNGYGDLMLGNTIYNLRFGVATGGLGAGVSRIRAAGGKSLMHLGAGTYDVATVDTNGFHVSHGPFKIHDNGQVNLVGDFGGGQAGAALRTENSHANGIALWATATGTDATVVVEQDGTGDMIRGFDSGLLKFRVLNQGQVVTPSISITGGADLSEPFDLAEALGDVEPGSVLVIDPENPGSLTLSGRPYDPRVAGIVSGAGGVRPGLTLSQQGKLDGGHQVALSGRVYVRASTENGPIRPGDMITTSTRPGLGMRATDRQKSYGAVVGKAMTGLETGEGLVLVLVGLQ